MDAELDAESLKLRVHGWRKSDKNKQGRFTPYREGDTVLQEHHFTNRVKIGPRMIFPQSLPFSKAFFASLHTSCSASDLGMVTRLLVAFITNLHSAAAAAEAIRIDPRHRAQLVRFLAQNRWSKDWSLLQQLAQLLLQAALAEPGVWVFILDQTYHTTSGLSSQNTYRYGNKKNSRSKSKSKSSSNRPAKHTSGRHCHCFVFGLLISPQTGTRIPLARCYYTEDYCSQQAEKTARTRARNRRNQSAPIFQTQIDIAAEMIRRLPIPGGRDVIVLGDTSFDARQIHQACRQRGFDWITPANSNRVLAEGENRRKLQDFSNDLSSETMVGIRIRPDEAPWRGYQRGSRSKAGKTKYERRYWAHAKTVKVQNIGEIQVVFSTTKEPEAGQKVNVQKILLSNRTDWSVEQIVKAYSVRWQIELFFKEMKSELGMSRYRVRKFEEVEGWVQLCCIAFVYLEWYRLEKLKEKENKEYWRHRTSGLKKLARQEMERLDLEILAEQLRSESGRRRLDAALRRAIGYEIRRVA